MRSAINLSVLTVIFLVMIVSAPANAGSKYWKGPGWYMTFKIAPFAYGIQSGPYASESACKLVLEPNTDTVDYACEYLTIDFGDY